MKDELEIMKSVGDVDLYKTCFTDEQEVPLPLDPWNTMAKRCDLRICNVE